MTKSTITREQLHERARENVKALKFASRQTAFESAREEILADLQLAELALAAMDSEPVIVVGDDGGDALSYRRLIQSFEPGTKLYRHAQPLPVVNGEYGDAYQGAREDLAIWKRRALEAEESVRRLEQINDHLVKEAQGESRMGEPVIAQPAPVVMDDEKLRALFDAWFASDCSFDQSPEASEADNIAWRESYWYVWQRCRAAMLQAGNSPVIPDCWKLVPVEPNGDMLAAAQDAYGETDGDIASTLRAAIAAAPQEVK
ncbi:hypothetical protein [Klebsiella aerogenes]|uniref:hypothetical protein n=1 Tax=Klebsiella aerogenes TaxID=548 RepID=UPI003989B5ED